MSNISSPFSKYELIPLEEKLEIEESAEKPVNMEGGKSKA